MKTNIIIASLLSTILVASILMCNFDKQNINNENIIPFSENQDIIDIPEEFYGKWRIVEHIDAYVVARDLKREYINDTFELHKNYIVYNGVKFEDIIIKDNGPKNYNELLESRMKPYNFMDKDDIAHMIFYFK